MLNSHSVPRLAPLAAAVAIAFSPAALAQVMPQGGTVKAGSATIVNTSASRMDINQASSRAVIDWNSFSIGQGGHVNVNQPVGGAMLSRVIGTDPSQIFGQLTASGLFALVNPNGVVFGPTARIDVGSLIASTANISTDNFMAGRYVFDQVINRNAAIVNQGEINAAEGGLVALVAPGVANSGTIRANLGRVALASGHAYTLDLFGDQLVSFAVNDKVTERVTDINGTPLRAFVDQSGRIEAEKIVISANAAKAVLDNVINMSGVLKASSVAQRGGEIVLTGEDIHVTSTGVVDVSGTSGGRAILVADGHMQFDGIVDARGSAGPGGFVEVSGKKTLGYNGDVLLSAGGSLLFDPTELDINAAMAATLSSTMQSGATATATTTSGDLVLSSRIDGRGGVAGGGLTLSAGGAGSVLLNNDIFSNNGAISITAGGMVTMAATGSTVSSGPVIIHGGSGAISLNGAGGVTAQHLVTTGAVNLMSSSGSIMLGQNLGGSLGSGLGSLTTSAGSTTTLMALKLAGPLTVTSTGTTTVDGAISAVGAVTFNGPVELRHGIFTTNGNVAFNGVVSLNPGNDEIGFKPSGAAPEQISTAAALGTSGLANSATANCNNAGTGCAAGSPQISWDYVTARVTVSTSGSGTINFANGVVWGGGTTSASLVNSVKYFHGEQVGTTRAALVSTPIRHFVLNLKTDPASSVSFNGVLGYSAAKPADLPNTGHPLSNNLFPSADNSFQIGVVTGSVSAAGASGSVDAYVLNGANTTTGLGTATIAGFVSPSLPGGTGTLITPAPNNANAAGIAPSFLSEISLPAAPPVTVVAGTTASATAAASGATQEANAVSSSANNSANSAASQVILEETQGIAEVGGRGPSQTADLGRGGATSDVFGQNFHVAEGGGAGPNADTQYFSETPFQSAERRRRQQ